uniref:Uncharacterized protein n=1 Tax=Anguilla anguilla TaxID=7936 RepID=A0A0E9TCM7_ANGAN
MCLPPPVFVRLLVRCFLSVVTVFIICIWY